VAVDQPDDPHVELLRTTDPVRAGLVRGVLESEGIPASTPGLEASGVMPHLRSAIAIVVRVPRSELERARQIVVEMEQEVDEEPIAADHAPYREAAKRRTAAVAPRLKRIAVVATFCFPGGGHFYAQRYALGAVVTAAYGLAVAMMVLDVPLSGYFLAVPWTADLVGALDACEASHGGRGRGARRLAPIVALVAIVALAALTRGPLLPTLAGPQSVVLCDYLARCLDRDEERCLLEAANVGPSLPEPVCLSCIARHDTCDEVALACEAQCWPADGR
jgi:hypothetical protein